MKRLIRSIVSVMAFFAIIFIGGLCYAQEENSTTLLPGPTFNVTVKNLAGNSFSQSTQKDLKVKYFKKSEQLTTEYETGIISEAGEIPVYARFNTGDETIYYYTTGDTIFMNPASNSMFYSFGNIKEIDLVNINTSKVTSMKAMFNGCENLETLDLSNFDTSNVDNMQTMFHECRKLTSLDLSSFDTRKVKRMKKMFFNMSSLGKIYVSDLFVISSLISGDEGSTSMFEGAVNLVGGKGTPYDSGKIDKEYARIDEGPTSENPGYFSVVPVENSILISGKDFNKIIKELSKGGTSDYSSEDKNIKAIKRKNELQSSGYRKVSISGVIKPVYVRYDNNDNTIYYYSDSDTIYMNADSSYMFSNLIALEAVDLSGFVTKDVETMEGMFNACRKLESVDLSSFDTSKVTNMHAMFNACNSLTELNVSNFDTSKVTNMQSMFSECQSLTELNVSNFDTSKVENMRAMFNACRKLETLDLSNFDTSNVMNMQSMFHGGGGLKTLDLSNFDTSKVTNMQSMFNGCKSLTSLDLSNFDTSKVTNMTFMFDGCKNLSTIYVGSDFTGSSVTESDNMFREDVQLVGGNGTKFSDLEVIDKTYALVDSVSQSGYFTDASNITVNFIDETGNVLYTTGVSKGYIISELTSDEIERQMGYSLGYYSDSGMTLEFDFSQPIIKYTEIYTQWTINQYTITFVKGNGEDDYVITGDYGSDITPPIEPTRDGYIFQGWDKDIPITMPAENITITAQWEEKKQSSGGYSGGGGRRYDDLEQESVVNEEIGDETQEQKPTDNQKDGAEAQNNTQIVHDWAYENGLTKHSDPSDARFGDYLIRSEMAKISSIFATKMLGENADEDKQDFCSQLTDLSNLDEETRSYIIESCELGYMGYESNGVDGLVKFRPYSSMVLAEASVIISRMMWGNQNAADGEDWYKGHLYASYNHELIDDIRDPFRNITRGEVFDMFYRVFQSKQN